MTHPTNPSRRNRSPRAAFTLIELMISIVLVLFLILGVNQIFFYTSQAVGVGEAINTAVRDSRAAESTFSADLGNMVSPGTGPTDSACLIFQSSQVYAFGNANDQASSKTGNPAYLDLANTGNEGDPNVPGDIVSPSTYNPRNHRIDTLSFFSRDLFHRQTGNLGTYVDNMACQEAWIWYGHAWLPDNTGAFTLNTLPGNGTPQTNPNNRFGSQFVLARMAVLLKEKSQDTTSGVITDPSGVNQRFFDRQSPYPSGTVGSIPAMDLQPLAANTTAATVPGDNSVWALQQSRFDLAATTINSFRNKFLSYVYAPNPPLPFYTAMMTPTAALPVSAQYRFQCNPYIPKPIDSVGAAQASPYFLGGCSQFMVEYAGDYVTQDNNPADTGAAPGSHFYGQGLSAAPDGQIDYVLVPQADGTKRKQIVWYGLPRSTSGLTVIKPLQGDVVPLNDWLTYYGFANKYVFEKNLPQYDSNGTMQAGSQYLCAWGPNDPKPKLIRITITITDAAGRIPQGLTYQYVYAVP